MAIVEIQDSNSVANRQKKILDNIGYWIAYYRQNIHKFAVEYLGITSLKLFQKIVLYEMNKCNNVVFISSRGLGKTYLTALFAICRAILYPSTTIVCVSRTRKQGAGIISKINDIFMKDYPIIKNEIESITLNQYDSEVSLMNGSKIFVCTANENSRGYRANILIVDEYRMVDPMIISSVLTKFLTAPRHCGFQDKPEYQDYIPEENKEVYLSSAWYRNSPAYEKFKCTAANMLAGKVKSFCCALPYQLALKEKLLSKDRIISEMSDKSTFSEISWKMEMEALFWSGVDGALYDLTALEDSRQIKYPFYPNWLISKMSDKRIQIPPKLTGEKRILSADIALMSSAKRKNDATSIFINQLLPIGNSKHINNIIYTDNNEGLRTDVQALMIRKLFDEYECDYLGIDCKGLGLGVVDALMSDMYDAETGKTYGALSCCNNDEIAQRCFVKNAPKVIWAIMGSSEFNSQCALGLREEFRRGNIRMPISEIDIDELISELKGYKSLSVEEIVQLKLPYIHISLLINELINLEYEGKGNVVRVKEKPGMRKDRYSSLGYNIYISRQIQRNLSHINSKQNNKELVIKFNAPKIRKDYRRI